jgi:hypothetical protein
MYVPWSIAKKQQNQKTKRYKGKKKPPNKKGVLKKRNCKTKRQMKYFLKNNKPERQRNISKRE